METIIVFFRDTLSGTLYTIVSIVCSILICICLWLLVIRSKKAREEAKAYAESHIVIVNANGEEEVIELKPTVSITNGKSMLPDIMSSATNSAHNVPASSAVAAIAYPDMPAPSVPSTSKPVVMINPLEVAVISTSLNVSGATSAQKDALGASNTQYSTSSQFDPGKARVNTAGTVVSSQVVSALVGASKMDSLLNNNGNVDMNAANPNGIQENNQNFTN